MIWILDSGSSFNIYNSLQGLQIIKRFGDNERFLNIEDGRTVPVLALGDLKLVFNSNVITLSEYHFCATFLLNVISVSFLAVNDYEISIKNYFCNIIMNDVMIMTVQINNGIYILSQPISVMYTSSKHPIINNVSGLRVMLSIL